MNRNRSLLVGFFRGVIAGSLLTINAHAALFSVDWQTSGDGLITKDANTGLEWLDLTETTNLTYPEVLAETVAGGKFSNWSIASNTEVLELWSSANIPVIGFSFYAANYEPVSDLLDLLGSTYIDPLPDYRLSWGRTSDSYSAGNHNATLLWATSIYGTPEALASINTNPQEFPDDQATATWGTYLYRASPVPEPSIPILIWLGLVGLSFARKNH